LSLIKVLGGELARAETKNGQKIKIAPINHMRERKERERERKKREGYKT
jgi:hypothetical protein